MASDGNHDPHHSHPTLLSTFTGLGGLDLGLEAAGFRCVGAIERDPVALRSLKANRGDEWPLLSPGEVEAQAKTLTPADLGLAVGDLTLLAGAPPCQPFSKAGQWTASGRRGLDDPRAAYLSSFLELLERFRPRAALLENVTGFVTGVHSVVSILEDWVERINSTDDQRDYSLEWKVLQSADFGVPQRRQRAIVVIHQAEHPLEWPEPGFGGDPMTAWDALHDLGEQEDIPEASGKWAELLSTIPEGNNYQWHTRVGGGKPLFGYRTRYWSFLLKLAKDQPSWTLPANPGPSIGPFHWDSRPLSIQELLRLQTFPDSWQVEGSSRAEKVRQVGNATPPLLGEVLGLMLRDALGLGSWAAEVHMPRRSRHTPPPTPVTDLPPQYKRLVGDHEDHPGAGKGPGAIVRPDAD